MTGWSKRKAISAVAVASLALTIVSTGVAGADDATREVVPMLHQRDAHGSGRGGGGGGNLVDHGGPVLPAAPLYAIWWGTSSAWPADAQPGLTSLLSGFGSSQLLQVATQYMRGATASTTFARSFIDASAPTTKPSTSAIASEIQKVLNAAGVAPDPSAIYFVFTSNFPRVANYCAWHSGATVNGVAIAQAYMPNTTGIGGCDPGDLYSANTYSQGTRSIANVTSHELMEAITDKTPGNATAWVDGSGSEIGDKCVWQFSNKVLIGSTYWQLQQEWSNAVSGCVQQ